MRRASLIDCPQRLDHPRNASYNIPSTCTAETLPYIQSVIHNTLTPSWINSVPSNYGEASAGSIKADEWRTLSTIYLPIALVTLWGDEDGRPPASDSYLLRVLDHTMALFQATLIACRYSMSRTRAQSYRAYLKKWVDELYILHPHTQEHRERPNIHAAGHIYDFLLLFGPVTSWWCFPFERLIGALQKIHTNERIGGKYISRVSISCFLFIAGVMERTIMESHNRAANIRRWLRRPDCPEAVRQVKILFDKTFIPVNSTSTLEDTSLQTSSNPVRAHHRHAGVNFSRESTHAGNATVIYRTKNSTENLAGQIEEILFTGAKVVFRVRRQAPLPPDQYDPFIRYSHYPAKTYSSKMTATVDTIEPTSVVCHAARFDFSHDRSVLCSLSRI